MTQTVRVVDGVVHEILSAPQGHGLSDLYPEPFLAKCVQAPDDVAAGWTYDGKAFTAPVPIPVAAGPRSATSYDLVSALSADEVTLLGKAKAKDQHLFGKRNDAWPEDNPKIGRFATALNVTPKAWFDRVFVPAS